MSLEQLYEWLVDGKRAAPAAASAKASTKAKKTRIKGSATDEAAQSPPRYRTDSEVRIRSGASRSLCLLSCRSKLMRKLVDDAVGVGGFGGRGRRVLATYRGAAALFS